VSQENVEIVLRANGDLNREGLAGLLGYFSPRIEWHTTGRFPDAGTYRGLDGVRQMFGEFEADIVGLAYDIDDVRDAGQWVVVSGRMTGRGRVGDAPIDRPLHTAIRLADGKYVEVRQFDAAADALAVAGLEE
jgi:ketosteroid isomerase-like protein